MSQPSWRIEGTVARLTGGIRAEINLALPAEGLHLEFPDAPRAAQAWKILGVQFDGGTAIEARRLDAYVRGSDLVATYDEASPRNVRAQIYWRCLNAADFSARFADRVKAAFDLIVSVNTSLLDSDPQSQVITSLPAASDSMAGAAHSAAAKSPFVLRPASSEFSYAELVHPAESCRTQVRPPAGQSGLSIVHHLFQQRLEKGVILRGWIRGAVVSRNEDEAIAADAYRSFAAAEPPLTV